MATPKQGYSFAGERFPGTTTIIGRWKDSGGLLHWAFKQGQSGAASLYENANKAADIGTACHSMIEAHINHSDAWEALALVNLPDDGKEKAKNAFGMYLQWERQSGIKMLSKWQEIQLVSPVYKFGGTPDAIGEIEGQVVLIDWKTSNGVYGDYLIQLAAYQHLINEGVRMDTGEPIGVKVGSGAYLCRFSKDFPDFEARYFGDLSEEWVQFTRFREAYETDKRIKKRAA
jgi:hypothetical protein